MDEKETYVAISPSAPPLVQEGPGPPSYDSVQHQPTSYNTHDIPLIDSVQYDESYNDQNNDDPPPPYSTITDYQPILDPGTGYAYPPPLLPYADGAAIAAAADYEDMARRSMEIVEAHHAALNEQAPSICCIDMDYLSHIEGDDVYMSHIDKHKRALPQIRFHVQCYHYEWRTEHYRDSKGNRRSRRRKVRVDTHCASKYLKYSQCWDFTKYPCAADCGAEFARVKFVKEYSFKDDWSKAQYEKQKSTFIDFNNRDAYYDFNEFYTLAGFRDVMTVKLTDEDTPTCMHPCCCCLACMVLGCMCYTHWFHSRTAKLYVLSLKVLQITGQEQG